MARNYYSRARRGYRRTRSYVRRRYNNAYARAYKANQSIGLYNPGVEYLAGVAVGVTDLDNRIPAVVKILGAALPLRGGIGGKVCRFFRGMLIGDAISHYTGVKFNVPVVGDGNKSNIKWG
ncbi:MAG TPA: hypothetical protein PKV78_11625 [Methanoculleus thermophilus]|nr:hypothetical protein [Methanoculleus thermophilus]